ncbi:MAG: hypothetical protein CR994_02360 [Maribacter sp.]|nr:MAG: hypothetical protein CR994_02360 [Maribacter sp.]
MSKEKRNYTVEFKQKAVGLSYARGNAAEVCREPGLNPSVLGRWRREAKKYGENSFPGKGNPKLTDEQREISELKKRSRDAELSIFQWIETWYNRRRIHSGLGYKTIEEFENGMYNQKSAA